MEKRDTVNKLYEIAKSFREAIERAIIVGDLTEIDMQKFPVGCCSYASDLLQRYLIEQGFFTWYISGNYGRGQEAQSHAWLETEDGIVIDITGDQYKYKKLFFAQPVYVGPRKDGFHELFDQDAPVAYQVDDDPYGHNEKLDKLYKAVLRNMQ